MKGELLLLSSIILFIHGVCGFPEMCFCHPSSKTVDCSNQGLTEVPSNLPAQTQILYLRDNRIWIINESSFNETAWLKILDLSNNSLSTLSPGAFHGLHYLQVLNLTQNSIRTLENKIFNSLPQLRELDLSSNGIVHLPESLGDAKENLTLFAVQQNQLQHIDRVLLESFSNLRVLLFKDNLWKCNCHLLGLKLWLESFIYKGGINDEIICSAPENWKGKNLLKIPYEFYQACPPIMAQRVSSSTLPLGTEQGNMLKPAQHEEEGDKSHSDCQLKPRPRPTNLRHAVATVVITGVVCGTVCLMMLAAAIYGCAYAAITAKYHREHLAQANEQRSPEEKEPFDSSLA
ncbi:leucine-rich repeat and transmembrane domain-containing protein 1 [Ornithorhynchus anatinus]|uniref:Leucine-rich repeat and transmembrane domain-containing protein 1 n=1 Tax=Ornithorhynchus anatinus TaxID=9258 RepID=F7FCA8_ORNAN|nr:leucine-rich repeat and transmembrane domain-containing protein 1 [Ornithorhynchus anatinus]